MGYDDWCNSQFVDEYLHRTAYGNSGDLDELRGEMLGRWWTPDDLEFLDWYARRYSELTGLILTEADKSPMDWAKYRSWKEQRFALKHAAAEAMQERINERGKQRRVDRGQLSLFDELTA